MPHLALKMVTAAWLSQYRCMSWCIELRSPQLDDQCSIESLEMADEGVVPEYPRQEGDMVGFACCEGSAARHAGIDVQVYRVPLILVDAECDVCGGDKMIKPGKILTELGGEGEGSLFQALRECIQHLLRNRQAGRHT